MIKAFVFDIGHTLVSYNNPINWKALYEPALQCVFRECGIAETAARMASAMAVLTKYNTRENPREVEVTSDVILGEIFDAWKAQSSLMSTAKRAFYGFFRADAVCYSDAAETLRQLHSHGLKTAALTDVAYGMDNEFALNDIVELRELLDAALTSTDVGYRKPHAAGFLRLATVLGVAPSEMAYVGDERKDIDGANAVGTTSILNQTRRRDARLGTGA